MTNKFNAQKTEILGKKFDSKKEADRYLKLLDMENNGLISNLQCQVKYELIPNQYVKGRCERKVEYIADFVYTKYGKIVVEDVKGYRGGSAYTVFKIKKKLMLYIHGIEVQEV